MAETVREGRFIPSFGSIVRQNHDQTTSSRAIHSESEADQRQQTVREFTAFQEAAREP